MGKFENLLVPCKRIEFTANVIFSLTLALIFRQFTIIFIKKNKYLRLTSHQDNTILMSNIGEIWEPLGSLKTNWIHSECYIFSNISPHIQTIYYYFHKKEQVFVADISSRQHHIDEWYWQNLRVFWFHKNGLNLQKRLYFLWH